ncbi:TilS substrate-binding domain-containing protein [Streptomyces griseus]|uniref:TilS substrate-binding domain-containing protein n=1 Tax=Streptomyces griseus TaxID=1911 RepID=UPI00373AF3F0
MGQARRTRLIRLTCCYSGRSATSRTTVDPLGQRLSAAADDSEPPLSALGHSVARHRDRGGE